MRLSGNCEMDLEAWNLERDALGGGVEDEDLGNGRNMKPGVDFIVLITSR